MDKPQIYVFDFDGTLADIGTRSPYAYADGGEDDPIPETVSLLVSVSMNNLTFVLTGRKEKWRKVTSEWLFRFAYFFGLRVREKPELLIMQDSDPAEKNHVFKERKLVELQEKYRIMGVFDDNPDMEEVCRKLGIRFYHCK